MVVPHQAVWGTIVALLLCCGLAAPFASGATLRCRQTKGKTSKTTVEPILPDPMISVLIGELDLLVSCVKRYSSVVQRCVYHAAGGCATHE